MDTYVLRKNFGWIERGQHKFVAAGTKLVVGTDDARISLLFKKGAKIELVQPVVTDADTAGAEAAKAAEAEAAARAEAARKTKSK